MWDRNEMAARAAKEIKNGNQSNPVPGEEYHFPEL